MFFGPIRKTRWPPLPLTGWDIFDFFSANGETEFNDSWQQARSFRHLPCLCCSGRSEKQDNPPLPLIGWDIFDFFSATIEQNSTIFDRKQDLNAHCKVFFRADRKNKMAALAFDWLRYFRLLLCNRWTEFNDIWQEARSQSSLTKFVFFG